MEENSGGEGDEMPVFPTTNYCLEVMMKYNIPTEGLGILSFASSLAHCFRLNTLSCSAGFENI